MDNDSYAAAEAHDDFRLPDDRYIALFPNVIECVAHLRGEITRLRGLVIERRRQRDDARALLKRAINHVHAMGGGPDVCHLCRVAKEAREAGHVE